MWILPKWHHADFGDLTCAEIEFLANALRDFLVRLSAALNDPPYNFVVDLASKGESGALQLHWLLRLRPRVMDLAGFELGSGLSVESVPARRGRGDLAVGLTSVEADRIIAARQPHRCV